MKAIASADGPPNERSMTFIRAVRDRLLKVDIHMKGALSVHEEERGHLRLHPHPMTEAFDRDEVESLPFRELWMRPGMQAFEELEVFEPLEG